MTDIHWATSSKGVRGGHKQKGAIGDPWGHNFFKLTLDILELQFKNKIKGYRCFWVILAIAFLISIKWAISKKVWKTLIYMLYKISYLHIKFSIIPKRILSIIYNFLNIDLISLLHSVWTILTCNLLTLHIKFTFKFKICCRSKKKTII